MRLLLLTGARLREILHLRWEHVDFERGMLLLPDSKTGKKTIVLNAPALEVLINLPRVGARVIAGNKAGAQDEQPRADLKRLWQAVAKRAGLDGVRIHDLRHTHASVGAGAGLGLPIIGKLLGHVQAATTARYAHLDADPLRRASDRIGSHLAAAEPVTQLRHCRAPDEPLPAFRICSLCSYDVASEGLGMGMRRRDFLRILGGAASALPLTALAQQQLPLIGFLNSASPNTYRFNADSFREGLAKAGFVEGRNIRIEERWARGDYDALPALAAELVAAGVVAIAATGDVASARAAQRASGTVPVVFTIGGDPVRFGLVKSINRPGANVTGILFNQNVLGAKRVELLREIAPNVSRVGLLMNPTNPNVKVEQADAEAGAKRLGLETIALNARNASEIDAAFEQLVSAKADAFITATDPILLDRREQIVSFAERQKLPAMYFVRQFAAVGGLLSYGPSISWMYRQAGEYIGQILKGSNPAEMPVLQPTQFELVVNLKAAKAIGLTIPPSLLVRADELIE